MKEYKRLERERDKIHKELTKGFTKEQFKLLWELIDVEIKMETYCGA